MINCSQDLINALKSPIKQTFVKFELYDVNLNFLAEINHEVTEEDTSYLTVDTTRPIRRSFDFKLSKVDPTFTWGDSSSNLFWIDKRVKLYTGLMLPNGTVEYIPQGVFIVSEPSDSHTLEKKKRLHVVGYDKMKLYTDKYGIFVQELTIYKGTNIAQAIKTIMTTNGNETLFNFDNVTAVTPYDLHFSSTDNIYVAIKQLADLGICDIYYDVYGYLRLKQINLDEFAQYPPVWTFDYTNPNETLYAGNERTLDESYMANHIRVIGGSGQTATVIYDLVVDENNPFTISNTIDGTSFSGTFSSTVANNNGLQLAQSGTNVSQTFQTQQDFQTGTMSNTATNIDNSLSLPSEVAIQMTGTLPSTVTNAYYYNDIWNGSVLIANGDKLVYDVFLPGNNPQFMSGLDGYIQGVGALRNVSPALTDQNGLAISPATDISTRANGVWYHRSFDLSSQSGKIITSFQAVLEGNNVGTYTSYFKDAYILDVNENIKATIFNVPINTSYSNTQYFPVFNITPSLNGGSSSNYTSINMVSMIVASQTSGSWTSPTINLSSVNTLGTSNTSWNYTSTSGSTTVTVQSRISTNGGSTWGAWTNDTTGSSISGLTQGTNLNNYQLQFMISLSTTDVTANPKMATFQYNVISQYLASGTFTSSVMNFTGVQAAALGQSSVSVQSNIPVNSSMTLQINVSKDNGSTWGGWYTVTDGMSIKEITNSISDLSLVKIQYSVSISTNDQTQSPILQNLTFNASSNLWVGNPYSIQRIGRVAYLWNNGSPDPVIATELDARNRAKWLLQRRLGFIERVTLNCIAVPLLEGYDFLSINDPIDGVNGNYRIESFSMPIMPSNSKYMTVRCLKYKHMISSWNF